MIQKRIFRTICFLLVALLLWNSNIMSYAKQSSYSPRMIVYDEDITDSIAYTAIRGGNYWYGGTCGLVLVANNGVIQEGALELLASEGRDIKEIQQNLPTAIENKRQFYLTMFQNCPEEYNELLTTGKLYNTEEEIAKRWDYKSSHGTAAGYIYSMVYTYKNNCYSDAMTHRGPDGDYILELNGAFTQTAFDILALYGYSMDDVIYAANANLSYEQMKAIYK